MAAAAVMACGGGGGTSPTAAGGPAPSLSGLGEWPQYHGSADRAGVVPGPLVFAAPHPAWASEMVDGDLYAAPVASAGRVFVATENNTVYAFEAGGGKPLWHRHLGAPVVASTLPCGNIRPVSGITGTPAVDSGSGLIYAVAFLAPGSHRLFALEVGSGEIRWQRSVDAPDAAPLSHQQRAALLFSRGTVYIAYGGLLGDCGNYHGVVVGVRGPDAPLLSYPVPCRQRCGVWAAPGPAADRDGNLYIATGNSNASAAQSFDYGEAVIKLSPTLAQLDYFAPAEWGQLNDRDADIGSVSPALLGGGLIFQSGKSGMGWLLRADHLGGIGGQVFAAAVCRGVFGGTAWSAPNLYVPCSDGLVALRLEGNSFRVAWRSTASGSPIVAGGAVWVEHSGTLVALDPGTGNRLYELPTGPEQHFSTPAAIPGLLFVAAGRSLHAVRTA